MAVSVQALRGVHDGQRSFTVVDSDALPISSVETFLRHLEALGYSPNTVKAYAHDLADLFNWVRFRRRDWRTLTVADVGEWVAWLRLPGPARQGRVGVLPSVEHAVGERTLQRKLAAASAFYGFYRRLDPEVTLQLTRWDRGFSASGYQPFLAHTRRQQARQEVKVRGAIRSAPEVIEADDYQALLDGCTRLRDRFLLQLLRETGMRIGEALGLRHEDLSIARREVAVMPRFNDNGARVKRWKPRAVPALAALFSGYARYLDEEYGDLDSDFVFVNLWAAPRGHAMAYTAARDVLLRLRRRTGLSGFTFHQLRHTYATDLIRKGTDSDWAIVAHLLGHARWASFGDGFCVSHQSRFNAFRRRTGTADRDAFLAAVALAGVPRIDLTGLAPQLKLEVQYVVQCFLDHGPRRVNLSRWNIVVRALHARGATSLLEHTAAEWVAVLRLGHGNPDGALFINWGHDQVDRLVHGTGWDREYPLNTWHLDRVGHAATGVARITFSAIAQPWLRDLAKRWARHRLSIGIGPAGVRRGIGVLGQFSTHLDGVARPPRGTADLTRAMVQRWCEDLARDHPEPRSRLQLVTALSTFLRDVHRYGWAPELASTTVVFSEDFPRLHGTGPGRALTEYLVAQIESDEALALLAHPDHQLMTRTMIRCGLRSGDCRQLAFDCLVLDGEGHPYLQYLNHKMKRTAFMPLDDDLAARIRDQQRTVLQRFEHRTGLLLFPGHATNPHGTKASPASGYRSTFQNWLAELHITDELGQPVWITPHQLRRTFGTRMINRDVPQHIVQQLMDHTSADMTAHYARLNDKTIRDAWAKAQLLDAHGNPVELNDDHPLADAAWARRGLDRAKQTLPNGYCGMPLNSPCEHANPCLTCPMFITNADFLPQHETQLKHTLELIDISREKGHLRVVEKNQEIVDNLQRIITACQTCPTTTQPKAADAC